MARQEDPGVPLLAQELDGGRDVPMPLRDPLPEPAADRHLGGGEVGRRDLVARVAQIVAVHVDRQVRDRLGRGQVGDEPAGAGVEVAALAVQVHHRGHRGPAHRFEEGAVDDLVADRAQADEANP
jgi:hypothetical protein